MGSSAIRSIKKGAPSQAATASAWLRATSCSSLDKAAPEAMAARAWCRPSAIELATLAAYKAAGGVPVVIPPAFGLVGLGKSTFTGDGDTAHEPAGPVSYWNRYVGVVQMHGHGTFLDERLVIDGKPLSVDHRTGDDRITGILPGLEAYQWSIAAPTLAIEGMTVAGR